MKLSSQEISNAIDARQFDIAEENIVEFIKFNSDKSNYIELKLPLDFYTSGNHKTALEQQMFAYCRDYANLITKLMCASRYIPSDQFLTSLIIHKQVLDWVFITSIWRNTDSIIEKLGLVTVDRFGNIKIPSNTKKLRILLALISLSSKFKLPWLTALRSSAVDALPAYIGLITQNIAGLSKEASENFNHLLEAPKDFPEIELLGSSDHLRRFASAFFLCSYATSPEKYNFKTWVTNLIAQNILQWLSPKVIEHIEYAHDKKIAEKPRVGVMLEHYGKSHAMFRCFNARLSRMAEEYELIAFIESEQIERSDLSIFDKVVPLRQLDDINVSAEAVVAENLDIAFYPSIGMSLWGICLSMLRLAPIQAMMGGHPSSSRSPVIDYCIVPENSFPKEDMQPYFSEQLIMLAEHVNHAQVATAHPELTDELVANCSAFLEDDDVIRIGINGVLTKVTYDLIEMCKEIEAKSNKPVVFVFFASHKDNQLGYLASKRQLSWSLKMFELVHFDNFTQYMKTNSSCHFFLPTIPFGGANSNIDAMVINRPKLFLKGTREMYTRTDLVNWDRVGLSDEFGCDSISELTELAVEYVNDKSKRRHAHELVKNHCTHERLFNTGENKNSINAYFEWAITDYESKAH